MANKNINILMKLTDKFTQPMMRASKATKAQEKQIRGLQKQTATYVNKANNKFLSLTKSLSRVALGFTGIASAISLVGMKQLASEAMELAKAQDEAETKLLTLLGNVPSIAEKGNAGIKQAQKNLLGVASNLQKVGIIGDEVTIAGMQQLATFQLSEKSIADLSAGMTDLLAQTKGTAATQADAVSAANMIGKAMSGQVSALTRVGIIMDDNQKKAIQNGDEAQRAAVLAEVLAQNVGGVNAALADTPEGKIKQFSNAYGDMLEKVGMKLLPLKADLAAIGMQALPTIQKYAVKAIDAASVQLDKLTAWVKANREQIIASLNAVKDVALTLWNNAVKPLIKFVMTHSKLVIGILAGVGTAFGALNMAMKVMEITDNVRNLIGFIKQFKTVTSALGILTSMPFGAIALAIAAIVAVGILVYKNWDLIKARAQKLWATIKPIADGIKTAFSNAFQVVYDKIMAVIDTIKTLIDWAKKAIDWVDKLADGATSASGGLSGSGLTSVPGFATGTPYFSGGPARINEGGRGEIVNLPNGTQIIPHDVAKDASSGTSITVNLTVQGNVIGNKSFMEECGAYISNRINVAMGVI